MTRKSLFSFLIFIFALVLLSPSAYAYDNADMDKVIKLVEKTNLEIAAEIDKAIIDADKLHSKYLEDLVKAEDEDAANELTEEYEEDLANLINDLVEETNELSAKTIEEAAELGITVICTWQYVEIGGVGVWIDPLRVVGF